MPFIPPYPSSSPLPAPPSSPPLPSLPDLECSSPIPYKEDGCVRIKLNHYLQPLGLSVVD